MGSTLGAKYGEFNSTLIQLMSSKPRGKGFCESKERHMMDNIRLVKPCNITQLEHVLALHNADDKEYVGEDITKYLKKTKAEGVSMRMEE
eukprot:15335761-Ditylum_brightwellii.AAC.1